MIEGLKTIHVWCSNGNIVPMQEKQGGNYTKYDYSCAPLDSFPRNLLGFIIAIVLLLIVVTGVTYRRNKEKIKSTIVRFVNRPGSDDRVELPDYEVLM